MNGDGKADLVTRNQSTGELQVGTSTGSSVNPLTHWGLLPTDHDFNLADVNGDGQSDALGRSAAGDVAASTTNTTTPLTQEADYQPLATDDPNTSSAARTAGDPNCPVPLTATKSSPPPTQANSNMPLGWADPNQFVGDMRQQHARWPIDCQHFDQSAGRIGQAGAAWIRLIVYWGDWINNPSIKDNSTGVTTTYQQAIDTAVARATARGFKIYMTLTGAAYDMTINGQPTNTFTADSSTNTYDANRIAAFGSFVQGTVHHFAAQGVVDYGIWNEPNNSTFLTATCSPVAQEGKVTTAELYRQLYIQGYNSATSAGGEPTANVRLGEFAAQNQGTTVNCGGQQVHKSLDPIGYLDVVANSTSQPLTTSGIAWHPYQGSDPRNMDTRGVGIGRIKDMQTAIDDRWNSRYIKTPHGGRPGLYITEFGYLNQPYDHNPGLSEKKEASWYMRALQKASRNHARSFYFYQAQQIGPGNPGIFDTGTIKDSVSNIAPDSPSPYGYVDPGHQRTYGSGSPEPLMAYCGIWRRTNGPYGRPYGVTYTLNPPAGLNCSE